MALRLEAAEKRVLDSVDLPPGWMWTPGVEVDEKSVAALLQYAARTAVQFVRHLSNEELNRTGSHMLGERARSVADWIETCLIEHPLGLLSQTDDLVESAGSAAVESPCYAEPQV